MYAYSIVAWEILTHKRAYTSDKCFTLFQLITAIDGGMRPPMPSKWSPTYQNLLTACWDADPKLRPEFSQIVMVLEGKVQRNDEPSYTTIQ